MQVAGGLEATLFPGRKEAVANERKETGVVPAPRSYSSVVLVYHVELSRVEYGGEIQ